jgi:hypothetical protein
MVFLLAGFCFDIANNHLITISRLSDIIYQKSMAFKGNDTSVFSDTNCPPVAYNMLISSTLKVPVAFALNGSDPDKRDTLTFAIVANPALGNICSFDPSSRGSVCSRMGITNSSSKEQDSLAFIAIDGNGRAVLWPECNDIFSCRFQIIAASSPATVTLSFPGC